MGRERKRCPAGPLSSTPRPASAQTGECPSRCGHPPRGTAWWVIEHQSPSAERRWVVPDWRPSPCHVGHLKLPIAATFLSSDLGAKEPQALSSQRPPWRPWARALTPPPSQQAAQSPPASGTPTPKALCPRADPAPHPPYLFTDKTDSWCYWDWNKHSAVPWLPSQLSQAGLLQVTQSPAPIPCHRRPRVERLPQAPDLLWVQPRSLTG